MQHALPQNRTHLTACSHYSDADSFGEYMAALNVEHARNDAHGGSVKCAPALEYCNRLTFVNRKQCKPSTAMRCVNRNANRITNALSDTQCKFFYARLEECLDSGSGIHVLNSQGYANA